jgi:hypothetical protein
MLIGRSVNALDIIHRVKCFAWINANDHQNRTYVSDLDPNGTFEANFVNYLGRTIYLRMEPSNLMNQLIPIIPSDDRSKKVVWARDLAGYALTDVNGITLGKSNIDSGTISLPDVNYNGGYIHLIPYQELVALYKLVDTVKNPANILNCVASPILNKDDVICGFLYKKAEPEKFPF